MKGILPQQPCYWTMRDYKSNAHGITIAIPFSNLLNSSDISETCFSLIQGEGGNLGIQQRIKKRLFIFTNIEEFDDPKLCMNVGLLQGTLLQHAMIINLWAQLHQSL